MLVDLPPSLPPPALTVQEESLVMCLRVATTLRREDLGRRMWRVYLGRLRNRDPLRDWAALAKPLDQLAYGEFTAHVLRCNDQMRRAPRRG